MGIDLLDFWRGTLSARRLSVLIANLPLDSALMVALDPDNAEVARWHQTDYMLADLFDITWQAHFKKAKPYPRPGDVIRRRHQEEARFALLQAQRDRANAQLAERGER